MENGWYCNADTDGMRIQQYCDVEGGIKDGIIIMCMIDNAYMLIANLSTLVVENIWTFHR